MLAKTRTRHRLQALEQLHNYLENEVTSLEGQIKNHDTEVNLVSQELDGVRGLVSKGLTTRLADWGWSGTLLRLKATSSDSKAD